jgi:dolichol-phosphate mannosyltransferase
VPQEVFVAARKSVTIVVPTYREAQNLPTLLDRIRDVREKNALDLDVIVVDDDSQDGTEEAIGARGDDWVELIVRKGERGLGTAVLRGLERASGDVLVVMDADLSHPPEVLPSMLEALASGFDFVIGSRYVPGGTTSDDWGFLRWLNSRIATLLARPFTNVADPMSGFFAVERSTLERGVDFNPVGYKIGLELIVKCRCVRVGELPIHFEDRRYGESKLTLTEQLQYLRHLRRLLIFKFGVWSHLMQFLIVGALGMLVNLGVLTLLVAAGVAERAAIAAAIGISVVFNFFLNRRFSFSYARSGPILKQAAGFVLASSAGALVNFGVTWSLRSSFPAMMLQAAAAVGIAVGSLLNFAANRYLVFRHEHIRPGAS